MVLKIYLQTSIISKPENLSEMQIFRPTTDSADFCQNL